MNSQLNDNITITIKCSSIDLSKCTKQGLDLMMDILLCQEWYEKAAEVRDEILKRRLKK
jgi:protein-arginine kinase activator protein McsA